MKFTPTCYGTPYAESVSGKWVARATRPCRSATRRPEERGALFQKACLYWLQACSPFRPAGRRAAQASGLCYPNTNLRARAGFTLAEVLAALLFMAIVIPAAVQGLRSAKPAGQVAGRKSEAARVAERVLNESSVTTNWNKSSLGGVIGEGTHQFRWLLRNEPWNLDPLRLVSVQVTFAVQGQDYDVRLSTLAANSQPQ